MLWRVDTPVGTSCLLPRSMWFDWRTTWMVVDAVAIEHRSVPSPVGLAETEEFCESTGQQVHEQTKCGIDTTIWKVRQWIHRC